jgi:hypothetical protein
MTPRQADAEVAKSGPDALDYALKPAAEHDVEPAWRAALARAAAWARRQMARVLAAVSRQCIFRGHP